MKLLILNQNSPWLHHGKCKASSGEVMHNDVVMYLDVNNEPQNLKAALMTMCQIE